MLPAVGTDAEWQAVVFDEKTVRPAAEDLAARLGLAGAALRRYPGGSRPVYAVGDRRVLKLYPTVSAPDSVSEARVLDYLRTRTGLSVKPERCSPRCTAWTPNHCTRSSARQTGPAFSPASARRPRSASVRWSSRTWLSQIEGFISRGDPRLLGRILAAYGRSFHPRELLAYTLLHVHSNLPECLSELPASPEPTLDSLALTWFGTT